MTDDLPVIVVAAVIIGEMGVLMAERRKGDHFGGHWEFPGGKVKPGESPCTALKRELREELAIATEVQEPLFFSYCEYFEKRVLLLFYSCTIIDGQPTPVECASVRWVGSEQIGALLVPPADGAVMGKILELMEKGDAAKKGVRTRGHV